MPASHPSSSAAAKGSASTSFASHVANNPNLSSRLQPLLPAGTTIQAAASGFKNQGQFISALHVSRNLNIPFSQLKGEMTGADRDSLGHAIQDLRPNLDSKTVKNNVKLAERQTKTDLEESGEIEN
jgi:hypothetical protein